MVRIIDVRCPYCAYRFRVALPAWPVPRSGTRHLVGCPEDASLLRINLDTSAWRVVTKEEADAPGTTFARSIREVT